MTNVIDMRHQTRWPRTKEQRASALHAGLEAAADRCASEAKFRLLRQLIETTEAYARLYGAEEARRASALAIDRSESRR